MVGTATTRSETWAEERKMTQSGSGWASEETKRRVPKKWPGNNARVSTHAQPDHDAAWRWCGGGGRGIFSHVQGEGNGLGRLDRPDRLAAARSAGHAARVPMMPNLADGRAAVGGSGQSGLWRVVSAVWWPDAIRDSKIWAGRSEATGQRWLLSESEWSGALLACSWCAGCAGRASPRLRTFWTLADDRPT